ncbi:hypothetical protein TrVE_jg10580 [Triparma verrucosa]|uniref:peptidylprolyl isomerase n=2 Tax=Triparma TaxID=722752 RepID=A0A9W7EGV2_9STRA|nr:hypothetical protein TrST_g10655 [Triparma strigata]GMH82212.1 hypothetical protein TrVE_jg10580 [Triparma verrucosa]
MLKKSLLPLCLLSTSLLLSTSYTPPSLTRTSFLKLSTLSTLTLLNPTLAYASESDFTETPSGLKYKVMKQGTGSKPSPGSMVKAHYTGWLDDFNSEKKFDSSYDRSRPFSFKVGTGQVIKGWDEVILDMEVGEKRQVIIPSGLGYGERGAGGIIPGGATLYFEMELLSIG